MSFEVWKLADPSAKISNERHKVNNSSNIYKETKKTILSKKCKSVD